MIIFIINQVTVRRRSRSSGDHATVLLTVQEVSATGQLLVLVRVVTDASDPSDPYGMNSLGLERSVKKQRNGKPRATATRRPAARVLVQHQQHYQQE